MAAAALGTVTIFADGSEFRDYFKRHYGPTIAAYARLADHTVKVAAPLTKERSCWAGADDARAVDLP